MAASKRARVTITTTSEDRPDLADEAPRWVRGDFADSSWEDAPEALVRPESVAISIRFPAKMLEILRAFAAREGVGYQVLIKRWLDERLVIERDKLAPARPAPAAPRPERMRDSAVIDGPHYEIN